jgi:hypothetical protein
VPRGYTARGRPDWLCRAREVEQVGTLGIIELQRVGERLEHAVGGAGQVAALQAGVVGDTHAGQHSDLLATQSGNAASAVVGQPHVGGL